MAHLAQITLKAGEVLVDQRQHVGVRHGCRRSLVLPQLANDFMGEGDMEAARSFFEDFAYPELVLRMAVGVQEADSDRLNSSLCHLAANPRDNGLVQRVQDGAINQDAFGDCEDVFGLHQWGRLLDADVVHVVPVLSADRQEISKPLCNQKADPRSFALDDRVRDQRGGMYQGAQVTPAGRVLLQDRRESGSHGSGGVVVGG